MKNSISLKSWLMVSLFLPAVCSTFCRANAEVISTWVSGSDTIYNHGVYGIRGVADAANIPGARYNSISWTGSADNLWLFGGRGYVSGGGFGYFNDLWKYDGTNWTWISGSDIVNNIGVYGTKGVADPNNTPGARASSISWTDSAGDLWLFGGVGYDSVAGYGSLNDLWKYDGTNWTWVSGSDTRNNYGVYGIRGVADAANIPGARYHSISWTDSAGDLWLFGGHGYDSASGYGRLNDLWKYDGTNWTWVSGSDTVMNIGVYGTKSVGDAANIPGARASSISWTDSAGDLWLFGGGGVDSAGGFGRLNDLWKYDGTNWTWVSGSDTVMNIGVYGTKSVGDPANIPGARGYSISWTDSAGDLWLFGGHGYDSASGYGRLNDLWKYDGTNWTWVSGSDTVMNIGVYGTKGVADAANIPGARATSVSWTDSSGDLWLFGGDGYDSAGNGGWLNDLWKIQIYYDVSPVADAGDDITAYAWIDGFGVVEPNGFGSSDLDGDDLTYRWSWEIGGEVFEANGVMPLIALPVGEHTVELVVYDGDLYSEPNSVLVTVIEPVEARGFVVPRVVNLSSRGKYVMAILYLPDGIDKGDIVDGSFGFYVDGNGASVPADRQRVIGGGNVGRMFVVFDRAAVIEAVDGQSSVKVYVAGELLSGECIFAEDTIRVVRAQRRLPRRTSGGRSRER